MHRHNESSNYPWAHVLSLGDFIVTLEYMYHHKEDLSWHLSVCIIIRMLDSDPWVPMPSLGGFVVIFEYIYND